MIKNSEIKNRSLHLETGQDFIELLFLQKLTFFETQSNRKPLWACVHSH